MPVRNPFNIAIRPSEVLLTALFLCLVLAYGQAGWIVSVVSVALAWVLMAVGQYFYSSIDRLDSFPYVRVAYVLVAVFITLDAVLAVYVVAYGDMELFLRDFLLYFTAVVSAWVAIVGKKAIVTADDGDLEAEEYQPVTQAPYPAAEEVKDTGRLTVRKGSSLHIVDTDDIIYISAMGDYVSITTVSGKYVKEGTMAYYERFLAEGFARIHRSTIVNIAKISTIELYGKQTYSVRLCNGESVKASATGYRTLKNKLEK